MNEQPKEEQITNWIDEEIKQVDENRPTDYPEPLKFEEGRIMEVDISIAKEWEKFVDESNGVVV